MRVRFRLFESTFSSWTSLLQEAADFASTFQPDHLISVSHSEDEGNGVVVVWYWEALPEFVTPPTEPER